MSVLSGSKLHDTLKMFLNELFRKVDFEKKSADKTKALKITPKSVPP